MKKRSRALLSKIDKITAGGELHPALKTMLRETNGKILICQQIPAEF